MIVAHGIAERLAGRLRTFWQSRKWVPYYNASVLTSAFYAVCGVTLAQVVLIWMFYVPVLTAIPVILVRDVMANRPKQVRTALFSAMMFVIVAGAVWLSWRIVAAD